MKVIKTETVKTDGFEMDYFCFGRGEKKMVILPGLSVQSVMPFAQTVADDYSIMTDDFTVFVFDRRREPPNGYSVSEMAKDTVCAIKTIGLEKVCLFGASQGGMIALEIAAQYPDLVEKLAVASTTLCMTKERLEPIKTWIERAKNKDGEGLYLDFGRVIYPAELFEKYEQTLKEAGKTVTENEFLRFVILAEAVKGYDFTPKTEKIRCPLFAVGSSSDRIFGAAAVREIADAFYSRSDFEYYIYDGYGHAVYDTAPDFKKRLYGFFKKTV